eukprot:gene23803-biopygen14902
MPRGHRTVARAWRGHGAGVARAVGHFLAWVARAWRGHGAGVARACPVTPGVASRGGGSATRSTAMGAENFPWLNKPHGFLQWVKTTKEQKELTDETIVIILDPDQAFVSPFLLGRCAAQVKKKNI